MPKTVTLRLDDNLYAKIKNHAINDNRPISNFIETATIRYIEEIEFTDDFEMDEIRSNERLIQKLKAGSKDAKERRGKIVE